MKKVLLCCICALWMSVVTAEGAEETCSGGTLVYGGAHAKASAERQAHCAAHPSLCNDHVFCKSNSSMDWWRAEFWCKNQGRKLASFNLMCPDVTVGRSTIDGACLNLYRAGTRSVWSAYPWDYNDALYVDLYSGEIDSFYRLKNGYGFLYAFCE